MKRSAATVMVVVDQTISGDPSVLEVVVRRRLVVFANLNEDGT